MTPSHSPVKTAGAKAQMEQRLASGEFGIPPNVDFARYNEAWSQLIEQGPKNDVPSSLSTVDQRRLERSKQKSCV